jgi:hypothetical protein
MEIETEQKLSLGGWQPAMADDASHAIDTDRVIAALERRALPLAYRVRLGQALDRANAPQTGKAGADEAVGRAVGAKARDFGVVWKV